MKVSRGGRHLLWRRASSTGLPRAQDYAVASTRRCCWFGRLHCSKRCLSRPCSLVLDGGGGGGLGVGQPPPARALRVSTAGWSTRCWSPADHGHRCCCCCCCCCCSAVTRLSPSALTRAPTITTRRRPRRDSYQTCVSTESTAARAAAVPSTRRRARHAVTSRCSLSRRAPMLVR
jgi:hypothetical protein